MLRPYFATISLEMQNIERYVCSFEENVIELEIRMPDFLLFIILL